MHPVQLCCSLGGSGVGVSVAVDEAAAAAAAAADRLPPLPLLQAASCSSCSCCSSAAAAAGEEGDSIFTAALIVIVLDGVVVSVGLSGDATMVIAAIRSVNKYRNQRNSRQDTVIVQVSTAEERRDVIMRQVRLAKRHGRLCHMDTS